ncbi:MAG: hypothetical protein WBH50_12135 [Fuerstiella sp.]
MNLSTTDAHKVRNLANVSTDEIALLERVDRIIRKRRVSLVTAVMSVTKDG